jgi:HD-GYP domain-containing protein (c-di-GMP phosphodiesterase class II)
MNLKANNKGVKSRISIYAKILSNFLALILLVSVLLIGLQYYSNNKLAQEAIGNNFTNASANVVHFIETSEKLTKQILNLVSLNPELSFAFDDEKTNLTLETFIQTMEVVPKIKGIYLGYGDNRFYEIIRVQNNNLDTKRFKVPMGAVWALIKIIHKKETIKFLDRDLKTLSTTKIKNDFNVSSRIWFKEAMKNTDAIRTNMYKFKSTQKEGMTFAKRVRGTDMVVAMDFTTKYLTEFLKEQNFNDETHVILYNNNGEQIISSQNKNPYNWDKLYEFFKTHKQNTIHSYKDDGVDYFVYHTPSDKKDITAIHIGILLHKDILLKPYMQKIYNSIYATIFFIILTIPFIIYLASRLVKPIRALMEENKKITNREFDKVSLIETSTKEFYELSNSFVVMAQSIEDYQKSQEKLLDAIIKVIAEAIDAKSIYTGGHCKRVPEIAQMLSDATTQKKDGVFKDFSIATDDETREFYIAAWLHDCGKLTTPEYVVDKATKLETITNRIHEIRTRFEVLFRDAQIEYLNAILEGKDKNEALKKLKTTQSELVDDFEFIAKVNIGSEYMDEEKQQRVKDIAKREWIRHFNDKIGLSDAELLRYEDKTSSLPSKEQLLCDKQNHIVKRENFDFKSYKEHGFKDEVPEYLYNYGEIYNLCVEKGTLTQEERFKINEHVILTIKMLEKLPFPKHLEKIPEYAGAHHETMIGTGYPRRLKKEQISIPARIIAIADIFEALSASDRPYKSAKTLSQTLQIMGFMAKDGHIDADLFKIFVESKIYLRYAHKHLKPQQIDDVDIKL